MLGAPVGEFTGTPLMKSAAAMLTDLGANLSDCNGEQTSSSGLGNCILPSSPSMYTYRKTEATGESHNVHVQEDSYGHGESDNQKRCDELGDSTLTEISIHDPHRTKLTSKLY
jgi:hypothetical protein